MVSFWDWFIESTVQEMSVGKLCCNYPKEYFLNEKYHLNI